MDEARHGAGVQNIGNAGLGGQDEDDQLNGKGHGC
jgi:hypothetical protein